MVTCAFGLSSKKQDYGNNVWRAQSYDIPTMISFKGLMLRNLSLQLRKTLGLRRELGIEGAQIERIAGVFLEREKFGKELLFTLGRVEWIFFERIGIEVEK